MTASLAALALLLAAPVSPPSDSVGTLQRDTTSVSPQVVRRFAPLEVRALLPDMLSSQTVHPITGQALRGFPVDDLADAVALQAGVVAQAGELHVRGGRAGETIVSLGGVLLNEPLRQRPMEVPLLALSRADLVSGAPEARHASGLAGTLDLQTVNPPAHPSGEVLWRSDGRLDTNYDRVAARVGAPLPVFGLGVVAAADVLLDDTFLPMLRTPSRQDVLGMSFGWRAENRMLGFFKLASVAQPGRFSAQVLVSREVDVPYSPNWSLDGWTFVPAAPKAPRIYSPVELPGYQRYRAADHMGITDERRIATLLSTSGTRGDGRLTLTLGWMRTRSVLSTGGGYESARVEHRPSYGPVEGGDAFYVVWGDYPLYRESASDAYSIRLDGGVARASGSGVKAGAGLTLDDVSMYEYEWFPISWLVDDGSAVPLDSLREYKARAPGAFGYVQGRWHTGGLVLNAGLRGEYFTVGSEGARQTLPGPGSGAWSFSPRLGLSFPISVRDVFSLAYMRIHQPPARDFLYDQRRIISNRQPLGNPALAPATVISYEGAVKHLLGPEWAAQASVFYRDVFGLVGARESTTPAGLSAPVYVDGDEAHAVGFELSLIHAAGERGRFEARYTWMQAWGSESRPEGDPYGPLRGSNTAPIASTPLSWDRTHAILMAGLWRPSARWAVGWSTTIASALPWTPKPFRQTLTDLSQVNSRRLDWSEVTNLSVQWSPMRVPWATLGFEVRNVFDHRSESVATLDGYPSPYVNTLYDDYGAYRTETGLGGGAYWSSTSETEAPHWVPVNDPRLFNPPRAIRASLGARW